MSKYAINSRLGTLSLYVSGLPIVSEHLKASCWLMYCRSNWQQTSYLYCTEYNILLSLLIALSFFSQMKHQRTTLSWVGLYILSVVWNDTLNVVLHFSYVKGSHLNKSNPSNVRKMPHLLLLFFLGCPVILWLMINVRVYIKCPFPCLFQLHFNVFFCYINHSYLDATPVLAMLLVYLYKALPLHLRKEMLCSCQQHLEICNHQCKHPKMDEAWLPLDRPCRISRIIYCWHKRGLRSLASHQFHWGRLHCGNRQGET